jgi:nucleotide-binding universal stress UspA family protein
MFENVLVGIDRHQGGRDALALAKQLVARDGRLTLAYVYPGDSRLRRESALDYRRMKQKQAAALLSEVRDEAGVNAELRYAESSSPGHGLHWLAETMGADVLVVGSSRRGRAGRLLLGDDTRGALSGSPCPVAIAPPGYSQELHHSGKGTRCPDMMLTS